jgi:acetyl-CoA carboxylase carboxyl transferase subunit alpha
MARRALLEFEKPLVELEEQIEQIRQLARDSEVDVSQQLLQLETLATRRRSEIFAALTPAQKIQVARHPQRPRTLDYIQVITDQFFELHGDRRGSDDQALVGGVGRIGEQGVVLLGHQKGRDTKENVARNFGMASPGGYRKAMRLMDHADRFNLPIFSFIDTPGAYAGLLAEEQGQGEAIAYNLREMFRLRVPILATVIGEGGSGGALGIGVADRLLMFEHSVYTVASPEACASILWRDAAKAPEAAEALRITGSDLLQLGVVDRVLAEPSGGNHWAPLQAAQTLKAALLEELTALQSLDPATLVQQRYEKFRRMGRFLEPDPGNSQTAGPDDASGSTDA